MIFNIFLVMTMMVTIGMIISHYKKRIYHKDYKLNGHVKYIHGITECIIIYEFKHKKQKIFKVRYETRTGTWVLGEFYDWELLKESHDI